MEIYSTSIAHAPVGFLSLHIALLQHHLRNQRVHDGVTCPDPGLRYLGFLPRCLLNRVLLTLAYSFLRYGSVNNAGIL